MNTTRKKRGYWTIERSIEEAKKYQHRSDFKKGSNRAYFVLSKSGLLEQACSHMAKKDTIKIWTKDACIWAAKQCKTKSEFNKRFCGAHAIAKQRGWMNELLQYFTPVGSKYKRCIYACEFPDNHVYVGLTYNIDKRIKQHIKNKDSSINQYIQLTGLPPTFKQITEYINYIDASIKEGEILNEYKDNGWIILNRTKTGGLGGKDSDIVRKWTYEKCWDAVKECNSYKDFDEKYSGAKCYAVHHGFINEIRKYFNVDDSRGYKKWTYEKCIDKINECNSITDYQEKYPGAYEYLRKRNKLYILRENYKLLQRDKWTFNEALNEALKYKTKKEFNENASGCYQVCYKNGWLNDVCKHMEPSVKPKYNEEIAKSILSKFSQMEQLKKNEDGLIRGLYWWLKSKKKIIEYKKYLLGDPLNTKKVAWTNELILDDVKKHKNYTDYLYNGRSYQYSRLHGLLDLIKNYYKNEEIWF